MSKIVYTRETTNDDIGTVETFYEAQADELSGEALSPYFESSESVTKSLNERGNIEFSVNTDITQKVNRAILTPANTPSEDVVPVVDNTNAVSYKPLSEIGGGGGGGGLQSITFTSISEAHQWCISNLSKIYKLGVDFGGGAGFFFTNIQRPDADSPKIFGDNITSAITSTMEGAITEFSIGVLSLEFTSEVFTVTTGNGIECTSDGVSVSLGGMLPITDELLADANGIVAYYFG